MFLYVTDGKGQKIVDPQKQRELTAATVLILRPFIDAILLGAIGDVVCGMPLVQRLRAGWPGTRIAWAVEPGAAPLLQTHAAVDEVIVFRRGQGTAALIEFLRAVRDSRPDLTLDLQRHFTRDGLYSSFYVGD